MHKTFSSLSDFYQGLSGLFFVDTSSSGRAGCHSITDTSSAKLKAFLNTIAAIFECMPVTCETANDKSLYVGALLTDSTKT